ncbi:MAG: hypothetical protein PHS59_05625 [Paludibacter sp.]|nr:hypothetical protein [Paludibacter sp.]
MKVHIIIIGILLLTSCNLSQKNNAEQANKPSHILSFKQSEDKNFNSFLLNFKQSKLPIKISPNNLNSKNLIEFNCKNSTFTDEYSLAFTQIPTNGNYIATITLKQLESYVPVLTTYDLTGQIIDSKLLSLVNLEYQYKDNFKEMVSIDTSFNICITDSVFNIENEGSSSIALLNEEDSIVQRKGKILSTGIIELN